MYSFLCFLLWMLAQVPQDFLNFRKVNLGNGPLGR